MNINYHFPSLYTLIEGQQSCKRNYEECWQWRKLWAKQDLRWIIWEKKMVKRNWGKKDSGGKFWGKKGWGENVSQWQATCERRRHWGGNVRRKWSEKENMKGKCEVKLWGKASWGKLARKTYEEKLGVEKSVRKNLWRVKGSEEKVWGEEAE